MGMNQSLPTGGFRWLTQKQIEKLHLSKYTEDSKRGLILEVDVEYPEEFHDDHNDCPLGPEKRKLTEGMLSKYFAKTLNKFNVKIG